MKLIRELHETLKEDSKLIIFCDNKILYDQAENTYSFEIKDLNFKLLFLTESNELEKFTTSS